MFTTRPYANKNIREIYCSIVNTPYNSTQNMTDKLKSLKGKTKLHFYLNIGKFLWWNEL